MFQNKELVKAFTVTLPVILMVIVSIGFSLNSIGHPKVNAAFVPIAPSVTQSQPTTPPPSSQKPKPTEKPIFDDNGFLIGFEPINNGLEPDQ